MPILIFRPDFGEKQDLTVGLYLVVVEQMLIEILGSIGTVNIEFKIFLFFIYIMFGTQKISCTFYNYSWWSFK